MYFLKKLIFLTGICSLPLWPLWYDVCIDPGHCGDADPGALGVNGSAEPNESDFNLDIALVCEADLTNLGWSVLLTRWDEHHFPMFSSKRKAEIANGISENDIGQKTDFPVSRAVSIHNNSTATVPSSDHGTETYYSYSNILSYDLAVSVHNGAWNYLQMFPYAQNRGVMQGNLAFIRNCKCAACLIEVAFVSHVASGDGQWYQLLYNSGGIKDYAAYGIDDGLGAIWFLHKFPTNLRLIWESGKRGPVTIVWHPPEITGITYSIYRREYPNPDFILIASGITDTIYTDNSTNSGTTYSYYVQAVSGTQESPRSNILSIHTPAFSSDSPLATAINNGRRAIFDNNGIADLVYSSDTSIWFTRSTDYGASWLASHCLEIENFPSIALDGLNNPHIVNIGFAGLPDTASGEDTTFLIFYSQHLSNSIWKNSSLYETYDSIFSVSFAIDPLDTGWVVFNTYDDAGNNKLKIGKFYTQTMPESLENVLTLDTYTGYGRAAVVIRPSDRSIWIVYERNNTIVCKWRSSYGNWTTRIIQSKGVCPSLSVAGDLVHFIWEKYFFDSDRREIQTCYSNGFGWSRPQTIATVRGKDCYPYIEKGAVAVWSDLYNNQWEIYASQRSEFGGWTRPQNISQTPSDSKYPQVAVYQTVSQTRLVYIWTEGNSPPYEVKILPVSLFRSDSIPLYAFDLGEEEKTLFTEQRTGYIHYGAGFEKSVDYDTVCLKYRITGLDPDKIYLLGLSFYQDESNGVWKQGIVIDTEFMKVVDLPCKKLVRARFFIDPGFYSDGVVELAIDGRSYSKAVLSGFVVYEFSKENRQNSVLEEHDKDITNRFKIFAMPNPVKGNVQIHYQLAKPGVIKIKIYSATGRLVHLISEKRGAGFNNYLWDGRDNEGRIVPTGVYFVKLEFADNAETRKVILLH